MGQAARRYGLDGKNLRLRFKGKAFESRRLCRTKFGHSLTPLSASLMRHTEGLSCIKTEVHAPGFYEFASKFYLIRARSARKRHADGVPFSRPKGARSCRILPSAKQAGQALRRAPHKIPHKSPALPDFYTSARAVAARPRPPCGREGGIPSGFSGTGGVSRGGQSPPWKSISE